MISQSQLDLFDPRGGRRGRCDGEFSKHSLNTGAHAYPQGREFEKVHPRTAPSAPCDEPDPAAAYPTRASRAAAFALWQAECLRYDAEGRQDEMPPLPAGYVSHGMARLQRGTSRTPRKWR